MANRYKFQFDSGIKPRMAHLEGFVSIGTGGLLNAPALFPYSASGVYTGTTVQTGFTSMPLMPGQVTGGVPTGWVGGFSGVMGLYGAGVDSIYKIPGNTGTYCVQLTDDWTHLEDIDVFYYSGYTGAAGFGASGLSVSTGGIQAWVTNHTVGIGNTVATGQGLGSGVAFPAGQDAGGPNKNRIYIQFGSQLPAGSGFWLQVWLRDSLSGPQ